MKKKKNLKAEEAVEVTETAEAAEVSEAAEPAQVKETKKKAPWKKVAYYALLVFFAATFVFSGIYVIRYASQSNEASVEYNEYDAMLESLRAEMGIDVNNPPAPTVGTSSDPTAPAGDGAGEKTILPEYAPFYELNNDMVGWINIPGTNINYPVLQSSPENADYYLDHTFAKKKSDWGAIYVREECDVFAPSDNLTIYGHYKNDGTMFTALRNFRTKSYWNNHRTFKFDTLYERHTYEIFAVFKTSGTSGVGYPYHLFVDAQEQWEFDTFVSKVKSLSFFNTGITPQYGEKLICLSSCEYTLNNGRLVIVARRIS